MGWQKGRPRKPRPDSESPADEQGAESQLSGHSREHDTDHKSEHEG